MLVANGENVLNTIVLFCTTSVRLTEVFASICKTTFYMKLWIRKGHPKRYKHPRRYNNITEKGKDKNNFKNLHKWNVDPYEVTLILNIM